MKKLLALFGLFRAGSCVADPAQWKRRQVTVTLLVPVIAALTSVAKEFGHEIPLTQDDIAVLAGGILVAVNVVLTIVTTRKIGLPPPREPPGGRSGNTVGNGESPEPPGLGGKNTP